MIMFNLITKYQKYLVGIAVLIALAVIPNFAFAVDPPAVGWTLENAQDQLNRTLAEYNQFYNDKGELKAGLSEEQLDRKDQLQQDIRFMAMTVRSKANEAAGYYYTDGKLRDNLTEAEKTRNKQLEKIQSDMTGLRTDGTSALYQPKSGESELEKLCEADKGYTGLGIFSNNCLLYRVATVLMNVLWLFSWVLRGANYLFNLVIQLTVVRFAEYANNPGLKGAWSIARDLVNVSLLFVLLYAALGLVFESINIDSKKMVKNVILVALLINFSFFFTGFVIKTSNTVSVFLYNKAGGESEVGQRPDITTRLFKGRVALSMGKLPKSEPGTPEATTWGGIIGTFIGDFILILITSIALLAAMVMFAVRFIKLLILLVLSPFAFLGLALGGKMQDSTNKWMKTLTDMCIFPIVFLLFLLMTSMMSQVLGAAGGTGTDWFEAWIATLVNVVIINGLIVGGLMAASSFGATGGNWAMGALNKMKGAAVGFAGQRTIGKAGYMLNKGLEGSDFAAKHTFIGGALKNISDKVASGKYGGKGSFKKTVDEYAKGADQFKDPKRKAQYIASLGRKIPYVGRLNPLGSGAAAQQAAYEKMNPKDRASLETTLEKQQADYVKDFPTQQEGAIERGKMSLDTINKAIEIEAKEKALAKLSPISMHDKEEREELQREIEEMKAGSPLAAKMAKEVADKKTTDLTIRKKELEEIKEAESKTSMYDDDAREAFKNRRMKLEGEIKDLNTSSPLADQQAKIKKEIADLEKAAQTEKLAAGGTSPIARRQSVLAKLRDKLAKKDPKIKDKIDEAKKVAADEKELEDLNARNDLSADEIKKRDKLQQQKINRDIEEANRELSKMKDDNKKKGDGGGEGKSKESGGSEEK
jgi:hypothetical protein